MGILRGLYDVLHPVRAAKYRVRRAVVPRGVRRVLRAEDIVEHPIESAEWRAFDDLDRAVTPRRRRRRR